MHHTGAFGATYNHAPMCDHERRHSAESTKKLLAQQKRAVAAVVVAVAADSTGAVHQHAWPVQPLLQLGLSVYTYHQHADVDESHSSQRYV